MMLESNDRLPKLGFVILLLVIFLSVFYTIINRRWEVIIENSLYMFLLIFAVAVTALLILYLSDRTIKFRKENLLPGLGVIVILSVFFYSIGVILEDSKNFKNLQFFHFERNWSTPLAASIILAIGLALFYFRFHLKTLYGFIEVVLGIIIGTAKVSENLEKLDSSSFYLAMLTASIYLIVRGFDNMHQGSRNPNDLLMKRLKKI